MSRNATWKSAYAALYGCRSSAAMRKAPAPRSIARAGCPIDQSTNAEVVYGTTPGLAPSRSRPEPCRCGSNKSDRTIEVLEALVDATERHEVRADAQVPLRLERGVLLCPASSRSRSPIAIPLSNSPRYR